MAEHEGRYTQINYPFSKQNLKHTHTHTEEAKALLKTQWANYMGVISGKGLGLCNTGQV